MFSIYPSGLKRDKPMRTKLRALFVSAVFTGLMLLLGLYLVLARDIGTRSAEHVSLGAFYFAQSQRQGFEGPGSKEFLQRAKDEHLNALRMNPADSRIWVNLSILMTHSEPDQSLRAQSIADQLANKAGDKN